MASTPRTCAGHSECGRRLSERPNTAHGSGQNTRGVNAPGGPKTTIRRPRAPSNTIIGLGFVGQAASKPVGFEPCLDRWPVDGRGRWRGLYGKMRSWNGCFGSVWEVLSGEERATWFQGGS